MFRPTILNPGTATTSTARSSRAGLRACPRGWHRPTSRILTVSGSRTGRPTGTLSGVITLLLNGRVHSPSHPDATAMAVDGGVVAWLGTDDVGRNQFPSARIVDLEGAFVAPAFVDSHVHTTSTGLLLSGLDLTSATSLRHCLDQVADYAAAHPGQIIWGTAGTTPAGPTGVRPPPTISTRSWEHARLSGSYRRSFGCRVERAAQPGARHLGHRRFRSATSAVRRGAPSCSRRGASDADVASAQRCPGGRTRPGRRAGDRRRPRMRAARISAAQTTGMPFVSSITVSTWSDIGARRCPPWRRRGH